MPAPNFPICYTMAMGCAKKHDRSTGENGAGKRGLPFCIERNSRTSFTEQVFEGLKKAILSDFFKVGEALPSREALAEALGVSEIVTREACVRLTKEGLVNPRPGIGSVVLAHDAKLWRGKILYIVADWDGSYYADIVGGELRDALATKGYLVQRVSVAKQSGNRFDFGVLDLLLNERIDLAILMHGEEPIIRRLSQAGVPFLVAQSRECGYPHCRGVVDVRHHAAMPYVVVRCVQEKIRTVLLVWAWSRPEKTIRALTSASVAVEDVRIFHWTKRDHIEGFERASVEWFLDRFGKDRSTWPELVWFSDDDYLAKGALTALLSLGVRIPEDLRFVAFSNRRLGPVFTKPLTRIEVDPLAHGARLAALALDTLADKPFPPDASLDTTFVLGETF